MADYIDHINQAEHNEEFCRLILKQLPNYWDWLITASFYAAIHYIEADFSQDPTIRHTEQCTPEDVSIHTQRERLVGNKYSKDCFKAYRKLRQFSRDVRYLALRNTGIGTDYHSKSDALKCLNEYLVLIKQETNN